MDLQPYVDAIRHELAVAAAAGGPDAEALAERLTAPLEAAVRLALLEALSEGAELVTREIAPGSVEVRLRGRDPEFVLVDAPGEPAPPEGPATVTGDGDDGGGTWRVSLRLPESLRSGVEGAARDSGVSVNAWLVRAVGAALGGGTGPARQSSSGKSYRGWVR